MKNSTLKNEAKIAFGQSLDLADRAPILGMTAKQLLNQAVKNLARRKQEHQELVSQRQKQQQDKAEQQYAQAMEEYTQSVADYDDRLKKHEEEKLQEAERALAKPVTFGDFAYKYISEHRDSIIEGIRRDLIGGAVKEISSDRLTAYVVNQHIFKAVAPDITFPDASTCHFNIKEGTVAGDSISTSFGRFLHSVLDDYFSDLRLIIHSDHNFFGKPITELNRVEDLEELQQRLRELDPKQINSGPLASFRQLDKRSAVLKRVGIENTREEVFANFGYYIYDSIKHTSIECRSVSLEQSSDLEGFLDQLQRTLLAVGEKPEQLPLPEKMQIDTDQVAANTNRLPECESQEILPTLHGLDQLKREMEVHLIRQGLQLRAAKASKKDKTAVSQVDLDFFKKFCETAYPNQMHGGSNGHIEQAVLDNRPMPNIVIIVFMLLMVQIKNFINRGYSSHTVDLPPRDNPNRKLLKEQKVTEGVEDLYNYINYVYRLLDQGRYYIWHGSDRQKKLGEILVEVARINAGLIQEMATNLEVKLRQGDTAKFAERLRISAMNVAPLLTGSSDDVMALLEAAQEGMEAAGEIEAVTGPARIQMDDFDRRLALRVISAEQPEQETIDADEEDEDEDVSAKASLG